MRTLLLGLFLVALTAGLAMAGLEAKEAKDYPPGIFQVYSTADGLHYVKNPLLLKRHDWQDGRGPVTTWISVSGPDGLGNYSIAPVRPFLTPGATAHDIQGVW